MAEFIQAATGSERIALAFGGRAVGYQEFSARVAVLARDLILRGVGPDVAVAVSIDRSVELLVAIHAVVAAGGHYVPLDPEAPADRVEYMLRTSGARIVLVAGDTEPHGVSRLVADAPHTSTGNSSPVEVPRAQASGVETSHGDSVRTVVVDCSGEVDLSTPPVTDGERLAPVRPETALYTLFTSGSTGRPKGVTVSHEAVVNRLEWMRLWYSLTADHIFLQKTPTTFDVSVWELFLPLRVGAGLVIAEPGRHGDAQYLADTIAAHQVGVVHFVPSMLSAFVDALGGQVARLDSLRFVFTSGEALTGGPANALLSALPSLRLVNLYGPTEAAVDVTAYEVRQGDRTIPIGGPVPNTSTMILDRLLQVVPAGVPGELYLGGVQLARGYAARADLTAERFVADPFGEPGNRLYRTGDLVRWNSGGDIEYLGRTDFQVKLRGQRLELGEVEAVLASAPGVVHAAAGVTRLAGGDHLVGYLSPADVDIEAVKKAIAQILPEYMRPTLWVPLDEMPLGSSGKVNRRLLPAPELESHEYVAPANEAETAVAAVFEELLGEGPVSVTASFFDLGGNSLGATRLAARAGAVLGVEVSVREVFDAPSVRELIAAVAGNAVALAPIVAVDPRPDRIPLSFAQQRMWFINQFDKSNATYNIPAVLRVTGPLDVDALRDAVVDVVARHEVLRTTFPSSDGVPYQRIGKVSTIGAKLDWDIVEDLSELEEAVGEGFDVTRQWSLRVRVLEVGPEENVLAVVAHHIAVDGESMLPLLMDLVTAYTARAAGDEPHFAPLPVQFADFAIWQHEVLGSPDDAESVIGKQLAHWREALAGAPDVLELPADRPRPRIASHRGASTDLEIPAAIGKRIEVLAGQSGATPFMVVHAALAVLLSRLSGTDDITVSTPAAGRGQAVLDPLIGMFVNTLVLRARVDPATSFAALIEQVRGTDLDAFAHADVPFESVVEAVDPVRSEAFSPLAQVTLSFDPAASAGDAAVSVAGIGFEPVASPVVPAHTDLSVVVHSGPADTPWSLSLLYATDLFDESTAHTIGERFVRLLDGLTADPGVAVGDAILLDTADERAALAAAEGEPLSVGFATVADMVAAQVRARGDGAALIFGERSVSYAEFGARVTTFARELISSGVGPESAVGVMIDRSVEMFVAIHAVIAAGGQYVPIDTEAPADRVQYMIDTAGVELLLVADTESPVVSRLVPHTSTGKGQNPSPRDEDDSTPSPVEVRGAQATSPETSRAGTIRTVVIDCSGDIDLSAAPITDAERITRLRPESAIYTLFTSGSTGRPKGVTLDHAALVNVLTWFDAAGQGAGEVALAKTPYTFDASGLELLAPLTMGAAVVIAAPGGHRDLAYLLGLIETHGVSILQFVPSLLAVFLEGMESAPRELPALKRIWAGGEALPASVVAKAARLLPDVVVVNKYGPTEAAIDVTARPMAGDETTVPIGAPGANCSMLVLDSRLRPVADGVPGELYLGGVQIARAYASQPGLTAERFVAHPVAPGERLYRTGDLAKRNRAGEIEYLGRTDFQVKLRGQRLELGEIEAVLAASPGVVHTAATVAASDTGAEFLVGYLAPATVDLDAVKAAAAAALPAYMVPTVWVLLETVPFNSSGKLDRRALPSPDLQTAAAEYVAPDTDTERTLAAVYADLLGLTRVGVTESFFDLGGNSLAAMRLAARAGEALGVEVSVRDIFDTPTVRGLAAAVVGNQVALAPIVAVTDRPKRIPLSFAQQRMWFINQMNTDSAVYNQPTVLKLSGDLDIDALHAALVDVVARHEVLRTTFPAADGVPYQKIGRASTIGAKLDWDVTDEPAEFAEAIGAGFDVTKQWPIRVRVLELDDTDDYVLGVVTHHIASDGESRTPLITDMVTAYSAHAADRTPEFSPLEVQFADYAIWQHEVLGSPDDPESVVGRQLEYWRGQLAGLPDVVDLPADRPRPSTASGRGAALGFEISADTGSRLVEYAAQVGATPFMVVHSALAVLLARLSAGDDIAIGTPVAGRGQRVLDSLIGMFVNTLILRTHVDGSLSFGDFVRNTRAVDLDAVANADVPFETVADAAGAVRSQAFSPFSQVWLSLNRAVLPELADVDTATGEVAGLTVSGVGTDEVPAKVDLLVGIGQTDTGPWHSSMVYATDLFDEATVQVFADQLLAIIDAVLDNPDIAVGDIELGSGVSGLTRQRPSVAAPAPVTRQIVDADYVLTGGRGVDPVVLGDLFARAAEKWGPRQAVIDGSGATLSYTQLDERSNRLARWLIGRGVGAEDLVAISMRRSVELLVTIAAVAKTGAGYVPVDPDYPADRRQAFIADSAASLCLTIIADADADADGSGGATADIEYVLLDDPAVEAEVTALDGRPITDDDRLRPIRPDNLAYIIFTSGSTGRPKGVAVTHWGLANLGRELVDRANADEYSRILGFASPSFDASVLEYMMALTAGGALVYRPVDAVGGDVLQDFMSRQAVSHLFLTPTVLATLDPATLPALRMVYVGGEAVPQSLKDAWAPFRRFQNLYGPTETTVAVTISTPLSVGAPVVLGDAFTGTGLMVLDGRLRPAPTGAVGDLYITGFGMARGYLGRAALTAGAFVANPHGNPGDLMYKTGDLVRVRRGADGATELEYAGRSDDQVKLRGLRIELGEIESVLTGHPSVHSAVVVGVGGSVATALAAYVVADKGAEIDVDELRAAAGQHLPDYMIPASIMVLDEFPRTPIGKLDKSALPEPVIEAGEYVAPQTPREEAVAAAFAEILGVDELSVTTSFFEAGGNSLSATRVAARASAALGVEVTLRDVFEAPSVRELIAAVAGNSTALAPVTAVDPRPDRVPLSFAQQRMWFLNRFDPGLSTYNIPAVLRLSGSLDAQALHAAVIDVVRRHEVLRTTFPAADGVPYQLIAPIESVAPQLDWAIVDSQAEVEAAVTSGFDLTAQWPIRFRLWRTGEDFVFALVAHHIAADGESLAPLVTDLVTAYAARAAGQQPQFTELEVQFADYAIWQHEVLGSPEDPESPVGRQLAYWTEQLAGMPDLLELPTDRPRPPVASQRGAVMSVPVPTELSSAIEELATDVDVTPFMVFHAALAVVLSRLSGADDVAVGTSVAGRGQAALDPLIGMFVNTIVLRTRIDGGRSFQDLLAQVRQTDMDGYTHAELPFETLVEALNPVRSEAFAPLAQVLLFFNNGAPARPVAVSGITVSPVEAPAATSRVDLTVGVGAPPGAQWAISLEYATDLFDAATVDAFGARLLSLLTQVTADPEILVGDCDLLLSSDTVSGDVEWGPEMSVPAGTVAEAVAAQIARTPDAVALRFEDREVTYREFGARVNRLARDLIAAGVGPESAVAVCIPRSVEMMVAIHAVIAAGGHYVPIAVDAPADRVQYMFDTAGVEIAVVSDVSSTPRAEGVHTIVVDCSGYCDLSEPPVSDPDRRARLTPDHAVYTLFTSGSTGRPKGVTLTHEAVVNRLWWGLDELPIDSGDTVIQKTPYTFDCSVPELLAPLMVGAKLVVLRDGGHLEPLYVADVIEQSRATMVHFVPSMLSVFLDLVGTERLAAMSSIRIISTTGEALPPGVAAQVREALPHILFYNLYGPTEAAVEITYEKIETVSAGDLSVPIGVPVWNSSAVILDARLHRVPDGVPGELYLGGVQLARGYASRGDLTADRFIADPYGAPGARLYRTGDLVRRSPDGSIDYLGRTDFQVKLRGQRIELGEIESVLASAPGVVHAAATVADGPGGSQHLVGYLAGRPGQRPDVDAVTEAARRALPVYMVPSVWMVLDDIALNSAGKLDRKALPEPDFASVEAEFEVPVNAAEEAVAAAFADVLGVDKVSVTGSFFDLGGNSLSAMRLAARAGDALGVDISVRDIFESPTVRGLVVVSSGLGVASTPITAVDPRPQRIPLSFAQQRMWFINQFDPAQPTYNIPAILRLRGDLDVPVLRSAVIDVVARQEILRTSFPSEDGSPYQLIGDMAEFDSRGVWRTVDTDEEVLAAAATGFDVTREWPLRVALRGGDGDYLLAVVVHHIGADAESLAPLVTDIITAYTASLAGQEPRWEAPTVQFADYAIWQHEVLGSADDASSVVGRQLDYWREHLAGLPDVLELPADRPRPPVASHVGARVTAEIPGPVAQRVDALARDLGASPFMVVHAALAVLLARLSATDDIAIATPISGRAQEVLSPLIGMFVNTLVLRSAVDPDQPFTALLERTRTDDLDGFAHADIPFETLVEALDPVRSEAFSPLAQVMLNFNPGASIADAEVSIAGLEVSPVAAPVVPAQLDLTVVVSQAASGEGWPVSVLYATELFDESTIAAFCRRFVAVIDALTADPTLAVGDAPLLIGAEHDQVAAWSGGPVRSAPERSAVDWPAERLGGTSDAVR